jgi:hypothetical protein
MPRIPAISPSFDLMPPLPRLHETPFLGVHETGSSSVFGS